MDINEEIKKESEKFEIHSTSKMILARYLTEKKSEPKKKYSYTCLCSEFQSKCGELDIICNKCGNKFEVEEL